MRRLAWLVPILAACAPRGADVAVPESRAPLPCRAEAGVTLQILGSGGPIPDDRRASAGYLVWVDGRARALVDVGGGTFQRFGEAGASVDDLEVIALTHLHADHSADLPALLKGTYFGDRRRDLVVVGPSGDGPFPAVGEFLRAMFGPEGAYAYLGWLVDEGGSFSLRPVEIDRTVREPQSVDVEGMELEAVGVEHGPVPALGYRLRVGGTTLAFSGDQNGDNPAFVELARGADILVMHHAVPEGVDAAAAKLHAEPSEIAAAASDAGVGTLVLSHLMHRSLEDVGGSVKVISSRFRGKVVVGEDLMCLTPPTS